MKPLTIGKMKSAEIAEWLGIAYSTFRNNKDKQLAKLKGYCEYSIVWGGIEISEVYFPFYQGELKQPITKDFLVEIDKSPISSAAGIARKFKLQNREFYSSYDDESLRKAMTKIARASFGKIQKRDHFILDDAGVYGYRYGQWCIKLSDYNEYRPLTKEESELFNSIIQDVCRDNPDKVRETFELEEDLRNGALTVEEFFEEKDRRGVNLFALCLKTFKDRTGGTLVRCADHHRATLEEMQRIEDQETNSAFGESEQNNGNKRRE